MNETKPLRVLSADAPKVGLRSACAAFSANTGRPVEIELLTAPLIRERAEAGRAAADVLIAPRPVLDGLAAAGRIDPRSIAPIGSVAVGVVVRDGTPDPDISSTENFRQAVLRAEAVVYNRASSGLYVAELLGRLGVAAAVAERTVIVPTGAAVMDHLARDRRSAIGFGHVTEIRLHENRGTHLVGPLPTEIGRETLYAAGAVSDGPKEEAAQSLIGFLASPAAKLMFERSGVL
jgi:molybdate transport system substrate-binding protein